MWKDPIPNQNILVSKIEEEEEEEEEEHLLVSEIEEEDAKVEEEPSDTDDKEVCACHLEHLGVF